MNLLLKTKKLLGWPSEKEIFDPAPEAQHVSVELADRKIGGALRIISSEMNVQVGLIHSNVLSNATETPLAIVCSFSKSVEESLVLEARRLCWSFSAAPQLIIIEPHLIRAFSCYGKHSPDKKSDEYQTVRLSSEEIDNGNLSETVMRSLHWVHLISGDFLNQNPKLFKTEERADQLLLSNLKAIRLKLFEIENEGTSLDTDVCHDLLARVIFVQFLWDRKDSKGNSALNSQRLAELEAKGILNQSYENLSQLLRNKKDTYRFFGYLNEHRFNGDMFGNSLEYEQSIVKEAHLSLLADFIEGDLDLGNGQKSLWREYAFDVIPLSFVSSIYEEFVSKEDQKNGAHYTPSHMVDFILDGVLPWNEGNWNIKVLDPACGSGIFLVKAYQRLIHRWKKAHPSETISADTLRNLMEENLFGVDTNSHAVRVAGFSLYLAMCDEVEPMEVWERVKFPTMRERRLINADFFNETREGFRTIEDAQSLDLVIGNAPWGQNTADKDAIDWSDNEAFGKWGIPNKNIGPLFLSKAAALVKETGCVSMLQPSQALLTNTTSTIVEFRKRFFETYAVEEVVNFAALRFGLFKNASAPACLVTFRANSPSLEDRIVYITPKPFRSNADDIRFLIESKDVNEIFINEAANDPTIWTILFWGGRRDVALLDRIKRFHRISEFVTKGNYRKGIVRGGEKPRKIENMLDRHILEKPDFPESANFVLPCSSLNINQNAFVNERDGCNLKPFESPQAILKRSFKEDLQRFQGVYVEPDNDGKGALCSTGYISIHFKDDPQTAKLVTICFNSIFTVYLLFLTSGRVANHNKNANNTDILQIPLPPDSNVDIESIQSYEQVDNFVHSQYGFSKFEWALIEDFHRFILPGSEQKKTSRLSENQRTDRTQEQGSKLHEFIDFFRSVLQGTFGKKKQIGARIFVEQNNQSWLPVRLITFILDDPRGNFVDYEVVDSTALRNTLSTYYELLVVSAENPLIAYRRTFRSYHNSKIDGQEVTLVHIIKPDEQRHWTRSQAMRDADEVAADIMINR